MRDRDTVKIKVPADILPDWFNAAIQKHFGTFSGRSEWDSHVNIAGERNAIAHTLFSSHVTVDGDTSPRSLLVICGDDAADAQDIANDLSQRYPGEAGMVVPFKELDKHECWDMYQVLEKSR